jgi:hypothetical protein
MRFIAISFCFFLKIISAEIMETYSLRSILDSIDDTNTVVWIDLDDTLINLPLMAGTRNMRVYLRKR